MRKKEKFNIKILRIITYTIFLVCMLMLWIFLKSIFVGITIVVLILLPVLSVAAMNILCQNISIKISAETREIKRGEHLVLTVKIDNKSWLCSLNSEVELLIGNTFFEEDDTVIVSMPVTMNGTTEFRLPVKAKNTGIFSISVSDWKVQDLMGFAFIHANTSARIDFFVTPVIGDTGEREVTSLMSGATESEESTTKGSDFAEVSDIREYVPGDRLRDIYWKLSAGRDNFMVKERISVSGNELYIIVKLEQDKEETEEILKRTFSLCNEMISGKMPVRMLCWNQNSYSFDEYKFDSHHDMDAAFNMLYSIPLSQRITGLTSNMMQNFYPNLNTYLMVGHTQDGIQEEIVYNV